MEYKGTIIIQENESRMPEHLIQELVEAGYRVIRNEQLSIGTEGMILDVDSHSLNQNKKTIHLTPNEFRILYTLVRSPNRVYSREQLITYALEDDFDGFDRTIDTYIKSIRKKIEPNRRKPRHIVTVHGVGYKYVP